MASLKLEAICVFDDFSGSYCFFKMIYLMDEF